MAILSSKVGETIVLTSSNPLEIPTSVLTCSDTFCHTIKAGPFSTDIVTRIITSSQIEFITQTTQLVYRPSIDGPRPNPTSSTQGSPSTAPLVTSGRASTSGLNLPANIGIAVALGAVVVLVCVTILIFCRRKSSSANNISGRLGPLNRRWAGQKFNNLLVYLSCSRRNLIQNVRRELQADEAVVGDEKNAAEQREPIDDQGYAQIGGEEEAIHEIPDTGILPYSRELVGSPGVWRNALAARRSSV